MKSLVSPGSAAGVPENHHATTDHPHASATRKAELRALVLKAQALQAGDLLPLPSIGDAA